MIVNDGNVLLGASFGLTSSSILTCVLVSNQNEFKPAIPGLLTIGLLSCGFTMASVEWNQRNNFQLLSTTANNISVITNSFTLALLTLNTVILLVK